MDLRRKKERKLKLPKTRIPKLPKPNKRTIVTIVAIVLTVLLLASFIAYLRPNTLNTYFSEGNTAEPSDSKTLVVEYRNLEGRDVDHVNISVRAIHPHGINFPVTQSDYEENIGKDQVRVFKFPVTIHGLREGSTYAFEVTARTPDEESQQRISLKIEGGG